MSDVEHAPYSPSTYEYRELCPCWEPSVEAPNEMAERGTAIHKAIELEDLKLLENEFDIACAELGIKYIKYLKRKEHPVSYLEFREFSVNIFDQWGWIDELLLYQTLKSAQLVDIKSGYHGVTDAEHNPQMQAYAHGVFSLFHWVDSITVHIPLPRRQEISTHTFSRLDDEHWMGQRIFQIIEGAKRRTHYNPGWKQCQYCGAKGNCPALMDLSQSLAVQQRPDLLVPAVRDPATLETSEQINYGLKLAKVLEPWIDAMKKRAREYCSEGYDLEDFKAVEIGGSRSVTNLLAAWDRAQKYGVTLDQFLSCCEIHFTELLTKVGDTAPRGAKGKTKDQFVDELTDLDALSVGAPKIAIKSKTKELT